MDNGKMNLRQKLFCKLYGTYGAPQFGNGCRSYMKAYNLAPEQHDYARGAARRLLTKEHILVEIRQIMDLESVTAEVVDKETSFLILQHADFKSKLGAIKEFNKVAQRIEDKLKVTGEVSLMRLFERNKDKDDE